MIIPEKLKKGDKVVIVSPAGKVEEKFVMDACATLRDWGLSPVVSSHALDSYGRFSAKKEDRLEDLLWALRDKETKAIFCSRGGYGAIQLIENIPLELIRENPKWLIGYSDITLLHALWEKAGVVSVHSPMAKHIGELKNDFSTLSLKKILFEKCFDYSVEPNPLNRNGLAEGVLVGGNLAVLAGLRGTDYDFEYNDVILFLEDIGESPYKIERMIYNLRLGQTFRHIKGLIIGSFTDCDEDKSMPQNVCENIRTLIEEFDFPVCFGFPVGHTDLNYPLVEGVVVTLNINDKDVNINARF